eukprot:comp22968_c0_seq1/m.36482 comp22968_c0_seq1/g.36482  ORF comp22968_c0_seq1/g.36482 comp22968_c0_seq1/m.36482 type:complete len:221 (-) comp22968_c0_seq1:385-1047(-)
MALAEFVQELKSWAADPANDYGPGAGSLCLQLEQLKAEAQDTPLVLAARHQQAAAYRAAVLALERDRAVLEAEAQQLQRQHEHGRAQAARQRQCDTLAGMLAQLPDADGLDSKVCNLRRDIASLQLDKARNAQTLSQRQAQLACLLQGACELKQHFAKEAQPVAQAVEGPTGSQQRDDDMQLDGREEGEVEEDDNAGCGFDPSLDSAPRRGSTVHRPAGV